jgi:hypothetical protein
MYCTERLMEQEEFVSLTCALASEGTGRNLSLACAVASEGIGRNCELNLCSSV